MSAMPSDPVKVQYLGLDICHDEPGSTSRSAGLLSWGCEILAVKYDTGHLSFL